MKAPFMQRVYEAETMVHYNLRAFVHNYRLNASWTKTKHLVLTISCSPKLILAFLKEIICRPKEERGMTFDEV